MKMNMSLYKKRKTPNIKGQKNPQEIFHETTKRLFELLTNHPHFVQNIKQLRKRYKINVDEIADISDLLVWQSKCKQTRDRIITERKLESLVDDFNIAPELISATNSFVYDYLLTDQITNTPYVTGMKIIKVNKDSPNIELNPDYTYLEITPFTTFREMKEQWKHITESRAEIRKFGVPATKKREKEVWNLYQEGLDTKEIASIFNDKYPSTHYSYNDILKLKSNYKKALSKLKPFE